MRLFLLLFLLAFTFAEEQTALEAAARFELTMAHCAIARGSSDKQKSCVYGARHMLPTFHNGKAALKAHPSPTSNAPGARSPLFLCQSGSNFC
jgi:hypothetical protein